MILDIVDMNEKQRFQIDTRKEGYYIRANQGHSFRIDADLAMTKLTLDNLKLLNIDPDNIVHGTYFSAWEQIKNSEGLNKMSRQHIHFANQIPEQSKVISGMRKTCQVIIYIDIVKAIESGLTFYLSNNKVILSEGNIRGFIPSEFFTKILNRKTLEPLNS